MRVVKSYVKEQEETDKFKKASRRIYKMFMRAIRVVIMSNPAMMLSMYASFLMISWFGAHLIVGGSLTTGELTSMFSYTMTIPHVTHDVHDDLCHVVYLYSIC